MLVDQDNNVSGGKGMRYSIGLIRHCLQSTGCMDGPGRVYIDD